MNIQASLALIEEFGPNCALGICCPPAQQEELFARVLHEAGREAVVSGQTVAADHHGEKTRTFIEWDQLGENAREGRRIQARFVLARFDLAPKGTIQPLLRAAGELAVRG